MLSNSSCEVVKYSLNMLLASVTNNSDCLLHFYVTQGLKEWVKAIVIQSPEAVIRQESRAAILILCTHISDDSEVLSKLPEPPSSYFLSILLSFLLGNRKCVT
jgi:hypothetical protein